MPKFFKSKTNKNHEKGSIITVERADIVSKYTTYNILDAKRTFKKALENEIKKDNLLKRIFMDLDNAVQSGSSSFQTDICFELNTRPINYVDDRGFPTFSGYTYYFKNDIKEYLNKQAFRLCVSFYKKYKLDGLTIKDFYKDFTRRGFEVEVKKITENLGCLVLKGWDENE